MEAGAGEITTLEDRLAQRVFYSNKHSQGYHTPSQTGGSTLHARGRCLPPTVLPSHAHGFISPLPAQRPARAPHGLPLRSDTPPPRPSQAPAPGAPGPAPCPGSSPSPFGRSRPLGGGARGRARLLLTPLHRGKEEIAPLTWLGRLLPRSRPAEPSWGLRGNRGLPGGLEVREGEEGEGVGMPGAASFLLHHRGSRSQAGRPRTLAHFLTASRSVWLSLTPNPTHTRPHPTHTHTQPLLAPSLPHSPVVRAPARDPAHTQRARRRRRPPRAPPDRGAARRLPACRGPSRAPAPPSGRGGAEGRGRWPAGRGAGPARRAGPSGSNTCVRTRPPGSACPLAAIAGLSGGEGAMERARREGNGSARALRGRAFPTRPQTVLTKEGKRVGGRGLFPTRNREIDSFRCTPSPPSHSLLGPHSSTL